MVMLDGVSNNSKMSRLYCSSKPGISSGLPIAASNTSFSNSLVSFLNSEQPLQPLGAYTYCALVVTIVTIVTEASKAITI
jgi:hypothetical protein